MARHFLNAPFDAATVLKTAGALTAASTDGTILDVGAGMLEASLILDITAIDVVTGDEVYDIILQGSNSATFASGVNNLWRARLGDSALTDESVDTVIGRLQALVLNSKDGQNKFRYLRLRTKCAGTTPSINYSAFLTKQSNKSNG